MGGWHMAGELRDGWNIPGWSAAVARMRGWNDM